jgi:hypothetical protein
MSKKATSRSSEVLRRAAIAIVATGAVAAPAAYCATRTNLIVVPPSNLPELARQPGDAMLLHDTIDGRTLLYIEQNHGAQLAIFDVSDPGRVKGEGSVTVDGPGPFDFVGSLGSRAEVVRFRQGLGTAVLDFRRVNGPTLRKIQGVTLNGRITGLDSDGFTVTSETDSSPTRDLQVVDAATLGDLTQVVDIKEVRAELTERDTGTTFLLTQRGLYEIRRPVAERENELRERDRTLQYAGGG